MTDFKQYSGFGRDDRVRARTWHAVSRTFAATEGYVRANPDASENDVAAFLAGQMPGYRGPISISAVYRAHERYQVRNNRGGNGRQRTARIVRPDEPLDVAVSLYDPDDAVNSSFDTLCFDAETKSLPRRRTCRAAFPGD